MLAASNTKVCWLCVETKLIFIKYIVLYKLYLSKQKYDKMTD